MKNQILELLEKDCRMSAKSIAVMLDTDEETVNSIIKELEDQKIILSYKAIINWEKTEKDLTTSYIELKITPVRGEGFDKIAERIYKYPQVRSVSLMSGAYDLLVTVEGKTLKDVAMFVSQNLSTMDGVLSTATHFVLKTYKKQHVIFDDDSVDNREVITL